VSSVSIVGATSSALTIKISYSDGTSENKTAGFSAVAVWAGTRNNQPRARIKGGGMKDYVTVATGSAASIKVVHNSGIYSNDLAVKVQLNGASTYNAVTSKATNNSSYQNIPT
jgi:hypothetical protein